ncbi:hypothetical protein AYI70_g9816 [Smittium culicis]|uniref:Cytochrome c oxidase assembly factor 3 mitochondrial coiled-coil domain-containing protein n=1 Tax=Smittium culicis TaxID=133412 RepID=A0A1R1X9J2_9FUNG|nr:hypothetical protein AYI70_g9816 [Smittium culicis]
MLTSKLPRMGAAMSRIVAQPRSTKRFYAIQNYDFNESFERGRKQYRIRNIATFAGLSGLVFGIYFSDVPMPDKLSEEELQQRLESSK